MKKSQADATTARNLDEKFDRGENVLDYFDVRKPRIIDPQSKRSSAKTKFPYPVKRNSKRAAVVGEIRALSQRLDSARVLRLWQSASSRNEFGFPQRINFIISRL